MRLRVIGTIILMGVFAMIEAILHRGGTLVLGQVAGQQLENSDLAYLQTAAAFSVFSWIDTSITVIFLLVIIGLWLGPIKHTIKGLMVLTAFLIGWPLVQTKAYYDKTNYAEPAFILPNESAFWIPDVGANRDSQTQFGSEEYYRQNKIAAKRYEIPHAKLPGSSWVGDFYVPTGRLIIVDRTPYFREWVATSTRGTSTKDESFPCQSKEGINITVGIGIGASVTEENSPKFLYRFGVKPPQGDRTKPEVIFTSVYYGRSLTEVMDGPVRANIQTLVCEEFTKRTFDENNDQASVIISTIRTNVKTYMDSYGITLDFIGWGDTFNFDRPVQDVINRRYIANKEAEIAEKLAPNTATIQALALAEATRTMSTKWDGKVPASVSLWWLPTGLSDFLKTIISK